jgi:drug/metabolite transporter (DMT)-like permease
MVLAQIFGSFAMAGGTILEKMVLNKKSIKIMQFQFMQFLSIILASIPFLFFFWGVNQEALQIKNLLILFLVIGLSLIANYFSFAALKGPKLSKIEPARMVEPLLIIFLTLLFSYLIGPIYERNFNSIIPGLIAALALIFSHLEKHHLNFDKSFTYAIIASVFFSLELVISRLILDYYSAITFYFSRCAFILIFTLIIFRPKLKGVLDKKSKFQIMASGVLWVLLRIIIYSGYTSIGIIETTLTIMLGPVLIYLFAWIFLKDKLTWKNLLASVIIILCILYSLVFN